jgi:superfamily II DNA or RNA helicase
MPGSLSETNERPPGAVAQVDLYSHHMRVSHFGGNFKKVVIAYCKTMGQYGLKKVMGKFARAIVRVFVGVSVDREVFNFHREQLQDFIDFIGNYGLNQKQLWIIVHPLYKAPTVELSYIDTRVPHDYQVPIIDYIVAPGRSKVVTLDPGRGKTFIALSAIRDLEVRTFFVIKPMYIEKWIDDAMEAFDLQKGDIVVIQGTKNLQKLMHAALQGPLEAKIILCSNATFYFYLKQYEAVQSRLDEYGYPFTPEVFYERLGIGLRVIDEIHQDFHLNFRQDCYTHVPKTLSLSGTLESDDRFINRLFNILFPPEQRYKNTPRDIYLSVEALIYKMPQAESRTKYMNKALKTYSHIRFEQSVLRSGILRSGYINMICDIVLKRFALIAEKGQKMIVYHSTVAFCGVVAKELARRHSTLRVTRYVSEDDYTEMLESDIIVSTIKSLGTAMDVPGLRVVLMTDAINSRQANLQCAGRLRRLKEWPDVTPEFLYLVNTDIQKHRDYHVKKKDIFRGRVLSHREILTQYVV